jgi:hypothetical protein
LNDTAFNVTAPFSDTANEYNVVGTYDGTTSRLYLNGSQANSGSYSSTLDFSGLKTIVAAYFTSSFTFDGRIRDIKIFDRTLSAEEVQSIYNGNGSDKIMNGCVFWDKLKGPDGSTITTSQDISPTQSTFGSVNGTPSYISANHRVF